jgi:3-oxoacyl-[acyl-carrier-protein] synthase-3
MKRAFITGLGMHVPETVLTNEEIEKGMPWLEMSSQWLVEHVGIRARRVVKPGETPVTLAVPAAERALEQARRAPEDLDAIILATNTGFETYPAGAARLQEALGRDESGSRARAWRAGCFDIQQGCTSQLAALKIAAALIRSGDASCVLAVGSDTPTRMVDWTDRNSCILLGDAAAAAVVVDESFVTEDTEVSLEILASFFRTDGTKADSISQRSNLHMYNNPIRFLGLDLASRSGESNREKLYGDRFVNLWENGDSPFFRMNGREVYRMVKQKVPRNGYLTVLRKAGLIDDIAKKYDLEHTTSIEHLGRQVRREILREIEDRVALLLPHNANQNLVEELAEELELPHEKVYVNIAEYANTSAASAGIALCESLRKPARYSTLPRRDANGKIVIEPRDVTSRTLEPGNVGVLLSFGTGNSWNYVVVRRLR